MNEKPTWQDHAIRYLPTGSRYMCVPPSMDTDEDFLVEPHDGIAFQQFLVEDGWSRGGSDIFGDENFKSWRKKDVNLIMTTSTDFYERFEFATKLCKKLNLLNKLNRITVFGAVLYGRIDNDFGF